MEMPFKVECYREQSLGIVLDPYKNSSYYYVKIVLSVIRTRVSIIKMSNFPGVVLERSRHSTKLSQQTLTRTPSGIQMQGSPWYLWKEVHVMTLKCLCISICLCMCM